jgi:hypothetical protein
MNIYQKINEVRKEVAYLRKDKKVETYWAVTHDMVTAELRPHLIEHGIVTVLRQTSGEVQDTGKATQRGNPITRYVAFYEMDFVNTEYPQDKFTTSIGSIAEDHGDKAPGKCASYAVKTLMLKTFNIETGEGDEGRIEAKPTPITDLDLITLKELCEAKGFYKEHADGKLESLAERVYGLKKIEDLPDKLLDDAKERLTTMAHKE